MQKFGKNFDEIETKFEAKRFPFGEKPETNVLSSTELFSLTSGSRAAEIRPRKLVS